MSASAVPADLSDSLRSKLGEKLVEWAPLGERTTYRVGGPARLLVEAHSLGDLECIAEAVGGSEIPMLSVGGGSNMLVADRGFDGIAITLSGAFEEIAFEGSLVRVGAAVPLPVLARRTAAAGLSGLEWAVGIPGTVGGGVKMNAGGHGFEIADVCVKIHLLDLRSGNHEIVSANDLAFGYRRSAVRDDQVVLAAVFRLADSDPATAKARIDEIVRWRRDNQPGGPNTGSVFVNPPGDAAGRLIDLAGCKGMRVGSAEVSHKHANFILVDAGGRADDVYRLMVAVRERVAETFGVWLRPETRLVGFGRKELSAVGARIGP